MTENFEDSDIEDSDIEDDSDSGSIIKQKQKLKYNREI